MQSEAFGVDDSISVFEKEASVLCADEDEAGGFVNEIANDVAFAVDHDLGSGAGADTADMNA